VLVFNGYKKATKGLILSLLALSLMLVGCNPSIQSALPPSPTDVLPESRVTSPADTITAPLPGVPPASAAPTLEIAAPPPKTAPESLPLPGLENDGSVAEHQNSGSITNAPLPGTEESGVETDALSSDLPVAAPAVEPIADVIAPLAAESQGALTPQVAPPATALPTAPDAPILETPSPSATTMAEPVAKALDGGDEPSIDHSAAPVPPAQS
jgi:hypothetical protein